MGKHAIKLTSHASHALKVIYKDVGGMSSCLLYYIIVVISSHTNTGEYIKA